AADLDPTLAALVPLGQRFTLLDRIVLKICRHRELLTAKMFLRMNAGRGASVPHRPELRLCLTIRNTGEEAETCHLAARFFNLSWWKTLGITHLAKQVQQRQFPGLVQRHWRVGSATGPTIRSGARPPGRAPLYYSR